MLVRLVYASRAADGMDDAMLDSILEGSRHRNHEHGITGVLCADPEGGAFLQALEGSPRAVNALYRSIVADARHEDVTLLAYEEIHERRFHGWRMGRVDMKRVNPGLVLRFCHSHVLDPFSMSGHAAEAFLEELADTAAVGSGRA